MATNKRARKPTSEKPNDAQSLLEALRFISVSQHTQGTPVQTHCRISNKTVIGFDGGITAGHFIDDVLSVCPHTTMLINALAKCTGAIAITELDSGKLSVKSGKFKALIPCVPFDDLPAIEPDAPIATLTDDVKRALAAVAPLAQDGGQEPFTCAVLLKAGTAVATNRAVVLESFHGIDLPPVLIPKASVVAICKQSKKLTQFGFSDNSATFYFEDDSFIKTQLFLDRFPDYERILNIESNAWPMPVGFYDALDTVAGFSQGKIVYFRDGNVCSHLIDSEGATYGVEGLPKDTAFNAEYLKLIKPHCHKMHFNANDKGLSLFFSEDGLTRGGIMKVNA